MQFLQERSFVKDICEKVGKAHEVGHHRIA